MGSKHLDIQKVLSVIQPEGLLNSLIKNFESRDSQQKMAMDVIDIYNHSGIALVEAGTGTGKSIAYLLPAILWASLFQERTLISTNTINLQEQLMQKDIPLLTKALNLDIKAVIVKGMNNYVCLRKLEEARHELRLMAQPELEELEKIEAWAESTQDGSRADLNFVPTFQVWDRVGAEKDSCNAKECAHFKKCHYFKARRSANDAQILVANHHMLFADLAVREKLENGQPSLIPEYHKIILDEAHNLEDTATEYFSLRISKGWVLRSLNKLCNDKFGKLLMLNQKIHTRYKGKLPREAIEIDKQIGIDIPDMRRLILEQLENLFFHCQLFLNECQLENDEEHTSEQKQRILQHHLLSATWQNGIVPGIATLVESLKKLNSTVVGIEAKLNFLNDEKLDEQTKSLRVDISALRNRLCDASEAFLEFINFQKKEFVIWMESQPTRFQPNIYLVKAPLNIANKLANNLFTKFPSILLCSATLSTNKQFGFMRSRLGLNEPELAKQRILEKIYESPFDYKRQALFAIPTDIPSPIEPEFLTQASDHILKTLQTSHGNAFVLFTSRSMLNDCYRQLAGPLLAQKFNLLKQGDLNRQALLKKFKETDRSILFGNASFWEGVDVAGESLRCVILVKLPFRVPSDPLMQARAELIQKQGGDPFTEYLLPNAVVKFKQGFGRLIRNKKDRGCIVCLDSRILNKRYGQFFLNSLPGCQMLFKNCAEMQQGMREFYRKTYSLTTSNIR